MQCLPTIEVLPFLNWIDTMGYARHVISVPIDELFLNDNYRSQVQKLEEEYRFRNSMSSGGGIIPYEHYIDQALSSVKHRMMQVYGHAPHGFFGMHYRTDQNREFLQALDAAMRYALDQTKALLEEEINSYKWTHPFFLHDNDFQSGTLADSVRTYLKWHGNPAIFDFFLDRPDSMANTALHFLEWVQNDRQLKNISLRNIPTDQMRQLIQQHVWQDYQRNGFTEEEKQRREALLVKVLIRQEHTDYLTSILESSPKAQSLEGIVSRSLKRTVRFKCTLLAQDNRFHTLVRDNWEEMNSYSGNHLDIYYSQEELTERGCTTADKLRIRNRVADYPAIYLWEYSMDAGIGIPVGGLDEKDLLDLIKGIVDEIVQKKSLVAVAEAARETVESMLRIKEDRLEPKFTDSLVRACARLQTNENWVRNTDENGRNGFIRDILDAEGYRVSDQTLGGLSPTGRSAGEIDIKVYGEGGRGFAILEGLNLQSGILGSWDKQYFRDHVNKVYAYDSNGNPRNYIIVYATTPNISHLFNGVFEQLAKPEECPYGEAAFVDITTVDTACADLKMACARYLRNDREVRLYVLCVRMAEKRIRA